MVLKSGRFYLRLTDKDRETFDEVAQGLGLSNVSEAVRYLMNEKHRALFGVQLPKKRSTKRPRK